MTLSVEDIDACDVPAAWLRTSPWQLGANASLKALLHQADLQEGRFCAAFDVGGQRLPEYLAQGQAFQGRLRFARPGMPGTDLLLHADFSPAANGSDWICTFVDLSSLESAHARRSLTLERLRHALDQLQELISMIDHEETMLFVNAAYASFFGVTPDDAQGQKARVVMGEDNYALTTPPRQEIFRTLEPVRYERMLHDSNGEDRVMGILLWPIKDAQGRLSKMATLTRDVTLRHRGMVALRQTLERLDALFEAGIEGILLHERGVIVDANPVACRQAGLTREHMVGQPLARVLQMMGVPGTGPESGDAVPEDLHLCLTPAAGGKPPLQIQSVAFMDDDEICHAVVMQDMSYRHQAQRRIDRLIGDLRQQTTRAEAADRGKSVLLASASHDLRQPIHSLGLFLTTIETLCRSPREPDTTSLRSIVQHMRASLDSLVVLLERLLGAPRHGAHQAPTNGVPTPLQPVLDELVAEYGVTASKKVVQTGHAVRCNVLLVDDDDHVLQAMSRLLGSWGHHTLSATSAAEAIRLCEAEPGRIDAVICDYMLDPSMDGLALLQRLRLRRPRPLPVCMITGDVSAERMEQSRRHGFTLLHKPVNADALQQFLQTCV
jgi:two-component system, sensor histidine kinase